MTEDTIQIKVTNPFDDQILKLTLPDNSTIQDWVKVFKTILIFQTFTENQVRELFEEREWDETVDEDDTDEAPRSCKPRSIQDWAKILLEKERPGYLTHDKKCWRSSRPYDCDSNE